MLKISFLSKIYPACHLDVNGIKPGSNSKMTDKHTVGNFGLREAMRHALLLFISHSLKQSNR